MAKVNAARYGGVMGTKLTPDDITGDVAIFTIREFTEQHNSGEGRKLSPVLRYEEAEDKLHYLNRTQVEYLIKKFGDDSDRWIGKKVVVEKTDVEYEGETFRKVYIMDPKGWDKVFAAAAAQSKAEGDAPKGRARSR